MNRGWDKHTKGVCGDSLNTANYCYKQQLIGIIMYMPTSPLFQVHSVIVLESPPNIYRPPFTVVAVQWDGQLISIHVRVKYTLKCNARHMYGMTVNM